MKRWREGEENSPSWAGILAWVEFQADQVRCVCGGVVITGNGSDKSAHSWLNEQMPKSIPLTEKHFMF